MLPVFSPSRRAARLGRCACLALLAGAAHGARLAADPSSDAPPAPPAARPAGPELLEAKLQADRLVVTIGSELFTEYRFGPDTKYPYFYPVLGPRSGRPVTVHRTEPYPHHSSIFLGCDRVNGGNYWQEGLERGRIVSRQLRLVRDRGERVEFEQECVWERPGAEPPFDDWRRVRVSAPEPEVRFIDFEVRLTARGEVRIEKTNHSLLAVRVAPDLAVRGGGTLRNARGQRAEAGTFGQPAAWAVFGARRGEEFESVALFSHPTNPWYPEPWFTRDYGFMSPTPLNWLGADGLRLAPGQTLRFRYRVVIAAVEPDSPRLSSWFADWAR